MGVSNWIRFLRPFVPMAPRRWLACLKRSRRDKAASIVFATFRAHEAGTIGHLIAQISQPLIVAPQLEEKRANLTKAIGMLDRLIIKPGETLSIWHCLGPPTASKGWASGRTIINDVVTTDPGGGLCQFSSLIYHLGLLAGLRVIERHHHSHDIYTTDATRFTPLGLDATIVYGFKDLRLANEGASDVMLDFQLTPTALSGRVLATSPRFARVLYIERFDDVHCRRVVVSCIGDGGLQEAIGEDVYLLANHSP